MSEVLVIKLGGTTISDQAQVLEEVAAIARHRPVVLVHGGGRRITEWLERMGVPSRFENGLRVTDAASRALREYHFPGNVRELENVLERALALCNGGRIDVDDLQLRSVPRAENAPQPSAAAIAAMRSAGAPGGAGTEPAGRSGLGEQLEDVERAAIVKALEQARYNKTAAAKLLGMSFRALRYRIKKLGIE